MFGVAGWTRPPPSTDRAPLVLAPRHRPRSGEPRPLSRNVPWHCTHTSDWSAWIYRSVLRSDHRRTARRALRSCLARSGLRGPGSARWRRDRRFGSRGDARKDLRRGLPGREHHQVPRSCAQAPGVRGPLHDSSAQRPAGLCRGGPGEGPKARHRALFGLSDSSSFHGRVLRQLLQSIRACLAGLRAGGGRLPHRSAERRPVLRAQPRERACSAVDPCESAHDEWAGVHGAFQRTPGGANQGNLGAGLQHEPRYAGARGRFCADHAACHGLRLHGDVFSGEGGLRGCSGERHLRPLAAHGLPHPSGSVRELVTSLQRSPRDSDRRLWCLLRALAARVSKQRLCGSASSCSSGSPRKTPS